jgi:hypothetical protein
MRRLKYQATAVAVIGVALSGVACKYFLPAPECNMSLSGTPAWVYLFSIVFFASTLWVLGHGVANRPVSKWIALTPIISLVPQIPLWWFLTTSCYGPVHASLFLALRASIVIMCIHQLVRRVPTSPEPRGVIKDPVAGDN